MLSTEPRAVWASQPDLGQNECTERWKYAYTSCHHCDTPAECAIKGIHKTLVVTHDRKYAHVRGEGSEAGFQCFRAAEQSSLQLGSSRQMSRSCYCTCRLHPPCDGRPGVRLRNKPLLGNRWPGVRTVQQCCNMCTNHPECESFEHDSADDARACTLFAGTPVYGEDGEGSGSAHGGGSVAAAIFSGCQSGDVCSG